MRNLERVNLLAVGSDEQPAGEPLFEAVLRIASGGLHCLHELCLNIAQSHPLFEKIEVVDSVTGIFDFVLHLECDRLQTKPRNDVLVQSLQ